MSFVCSEKPITGLDLPIYARKKEGYGFNEFEISNSTISAVFRHTNTDTTHNSDNTYNRNSNIVMLMMIITNKTILNTLILIITIATTQTISPAGRACGLLARGGSRVSHWGWSGSLRGAEAGCNDVPLRGWRNTVGNLNEFFLFRKADHGPRFADIRAKKRGVRFQ